MRRRREFITLLVGAAVWPFAADAQPSAVPIVGFVHLTSVETNRENLATFRRGLEETGYVEGQELGDRIPVGTRSKRSVPGATHRIGPPSDIRHRCTGEYEWRTCSESCDPNDTDRFYAGRRPGQDRPSR